MGNDVGALRQDERRRGGLAGIEGLRALAALGVLFGHIVFIGYDGRDTVVPTVFAKVGYGLVLFFVLSGFLLYRPIAGAILDGRPRPRVRSYARNRVLRIVPAYWVILLLTALVLQSAVIDYPNDVGALHDPGKLLTNLLLLQNFGMYTVYTGISPAWSLAVEAVFYVVLPVLGIFAARAALLRRDDERWRLLVALGPGLLLIGLGLAVRIWFHAYDQGGRAALLVPASFFCQADLFGVGMIAAVLQQRPRALPLPAPRSLLLVALAVAAVTVLVTPVTSDHSDFDNTAIGIASMAVVLAVTLPGGVRIAHALETRWLVAVGLCSYSVYLWHVPVIARLEMWGLDADNVFTLALAGLAVIAVTLPLSGLTYWLVERPAMRRRKPTRVPATSESAPGPAATPVPAAAAADV